MTAYYNDNDPYCAEHLRNMVEAGLLPPGDVDDRSIRDVTADDLKPYDSVHLFAGMGGWPLAARIAGIPDDRSLWSGSCPCQPFSAAGKRKGAADDRHLWPEMLRLVAERDPVLVCGEQVASKDGAHWLAGVRSDLEGEGYAVWAADLPAAGFYAPHARQRHFWAARRLADADGPERGPQRLDREDGRDREDGGREETYGESGTCSEVRRMADAGRPSDERRSGPPEAHGPSREAQEKTRQRERRGPNAGGGGSSRRVGDAHATGPQGRGVRPDERSDQLASGAAGNAGRVADANGLERENLKSARDQPNHRENESPVGRLADPWGRSVFIPCADGKWRRVPEAVTGIFPLAYGLPRGLRSLDARIQRMAEMAGLDAASLRLAKRFQTNALREGGNAVVLMQTVQILASVIEAIDDFTEHGGSKV